MKLQAFKCDNCGKESIPKQIGFCYEQKWVYLYNVNIKLNENCTFEIKDKHFCCPNCMKDFLGKKITEEYIKSKIKEKKMKGVSNEQTDL
jgi:hypothetical protein